MTFPPDDDRLVDFVRRHRPAPPPAAPELESQLMAAVEHAQHRPGRPRRRWAAPALAASLLLAGGTWVTWRLATPRWQTAAVDEFVTDVWYASAYGDEGRLPLDTTEPDWLASVYATPY